MGAMLVILRKPPQLVCNSFGLFVNRFIFFLILSTFFYDVLNKTLREKHHGQSHF